MKLLLSILLLLPATTVSREKDAGSPLLLDDSLSASVRTIVVSLGLDVTFDTGEDGPEQILLALVDLTDDPPRLGGVHPDNFIYPASVCKLRPYGGRRLAPFMQLTSSTGFRPINWSTPG